LEVRPLSQKVTTDPTVTVRGRVTPGATVIVGKREAWVRGGRFRARVRLKVGLNRIRVTARKAGHRTEQERLRIRRREPPPVVVPTDTPPGQPEQQPQQQSTAPPQQEQKLVPCQLGDGLCTPEERQERFDEEDRANPDPGDPKGCNLTEPPSCS